VHAASISTYWAILRARVSGRLTLEIRYRMANRLARLMTSKNSRAAALPARAARRPSGTSMVADPA
jgi:hypothetical protein